MYLFSHHVFPKRVSTCSLKMFSIVVRSKDVGNTGIESYFASSAATTLMIENIETPHDVKNSFVSTFAVPGSLLINKEIGLKESYVIFDCNEFAVLAWPAKLELVSGQKLVRFDLSEEATFKFIPITDMGKWICQSLYTIPPALLKTAAFSNIPRGVYKVIVAPCTGRVTIAPYGPQKLIKIETGKIKKVLKF